MHGKKNIVIIALMIFSLLPGCSIPDGENSINQEVAYVRRRAYEDWKAARERGDSQEARADGPLSLDDAIKLALQYNKTLQSGVQNREIARGQRMSEYGVILPSFSMTASASRTENFRRKSVGGVKSDLDDFGFGLSVTQPIWNGDYIPASIRKSHLNVALADEKIRELVQDLIQQVATTYYDVLLARQNVETQKEALASAEAQFRMVSEKRKQETATDYDVLRAQVDVATYRAKMISEQNAIDTGRIALLKLLGISQDSDITFSDKLVFLPMRPVFERAVELASCNRSDLRQVEITARVEQEAIRIAESAFWPSFSAKFSQNWGGSFSGGYVDRSPWEAMLQGGISFGIDNWGDLRAQRARARQAEIDVLDAQERTLQEIRREMNNLANAEEMVKALMVNQDAAREALRLVLVGYQAGVKTEVDVTDARKALTEVQSQYYASMADHTKARLNLQVAMGVLGPCVVRDGSQQAPLVPIANIEEFAATDYTPPAAISMPTPEERKDGDKDSARRRGTRASLSEREREASRNVRSPLRSAADRAKDAKDSKDVKADEKKPQTASERRAALLKERANSTSTPRSVRGSVRDAAKKDDKSTSARPAAGRTPASSSAKAPASGGRAPLTRSEEAQKDLDAADKLLQDVDKRLNKSGSGAGGDLKNAREKADDILREAEQELKKMEGSRPAKTSSLPPELLFKDSTVAQAPMQVVRSDR